MKLVHDLRMQALAVQLSREKQRMQVLEQQQQEQQQEQQERQRQQDEECKQHARQQQARSEQQASKEPVAKHTKTNGSEPRLSNLSRQLLNVDTAQEDSLSKAPTSASRKLPLSQALSIKRLSKSTSHQQRPDISIITSAAAATSATASAGVTLTGGLTKSQASCTSSALHGRMGSIGSPFSDIVVGTPTGTPAASAFHLGHQGFLLDATGPGRFVVGPTRADSGGFVRRVGAPASEKDIRDAGMVRFGTGAATAGAADSSEYAEVHRDSRPSRPSRNSAIKKLSMKLPSFLHLGKRSKKGSSIGGATELGRVPRCETSDLDTAVAAAPVSAGFCDRTSSPVVLGPGLSLIKRQANTMLPAVHRVAELQLQNSEVVTAARAMSSSGMDAGGSGGAPSSGSRLLSAGTLRSQSMFYRRPPDKVMNALELLDQAVSRWVGRWW